MIKFQIFAIVGSLIYLFIIFEAVRRQKLKEAYSLLWLGTGLVFLALSIWWFPLERLPKYIGIYYSPAAVLLFLCGCIILILVQFSILMSTRAEQIKNLTQELGLLQHRVDKLEEHISAPKEEDNGEEKENS